ncbi:MAG: hypothetical protein ACREV3_09230 [Gammaproteobacteria bacterium]
MTNEAPWTTARCSAFPGIGAEQLQALAHIRAGSRPQLQRGRDLRQARLECRAKPFGQGLLAAVVSRCALLAQNLTFESPLKDYG